MTGSRHEPTPSDDMDPTGVRALLANLPDPGPMPDDLVERISQSLELEQRRRAAGASGTSSGTTSSGPTSSAAAHAPATTDGPERAAGGGSVVSLAAERTRRRPGRTVMWLGGVAAVAMVATLSVNQLVGDGDSNAGVSAQYPSDSAADDGAGEAGVDAGGDAGLDEDLADAQAEPPPVADGAPDDEAADGGSSEESGEQTHSAVDPPSLARGRIVGLEGTITLSSTGWADEVSVLLASNPAEGDLPAEEGVECVEASTVSVDDAQRLLLSEALWDGEAARLLVAEHAAEDIAWVLSPDCREIVSGPVTLVP